MNRHGYFTDLNDEQWALVEPLLQRPTRYKPGGKRQHTLRDIVERTFGWFGSYRRLSKDYEAEVSSSEAMVMRSMIHIMLRRLA